MTLKVRALWGRPSGPTTGAFHSLRATLRLWQPELCLRISFGIFCTSWVCCCLLVARTLLGAPGLTTRSKKLLGAPGIATRCFLSLYHSLSLLGPQVPTGRSLESPWSSSDSAESREGSARHFGCKNSWSKQSPQDTKQKTSPGRRLR